MSNNQEISTLAGGCFWCLEAVYQDVKGVEKITSGYSGGSKINSSYKKISSGKTNHAEVVQLSFNPKVISFRELLEIFFFIHDPTTLNRQGNDIGPQYRSAVFYHSVKQKEITEIIIAELENEKVYNDPIVTEVSSYQAFFPAEEYHQEYYRRNPDQPYCHVVITPKVAKFRKKYFEKMKKM